jgi:hypothetical protein
MKAILLIFFVSSMFLSSQAQKFSNDKTSCLSAISQKGYKYAQQKDNPSVYWYMQYDQYGESLVQLTFDGNILRKIVIGHKDSKSNLDRFRDLFKQVTQEETLNFDWTNDGNGYGKAFNTSYYSGNARYECDTRKYFFVIIPIN